MSGILNLAPGLYRNIAAEVYHQRVLGLVSKSALDEADRSLAHYKAWVEGTEREPTPALLFGQALHMAVLETEKFLQTYAVLPNFGDGRTTAAKEKKARWLAENGGKKPLTQEDAEAIQGIYRSIQSHQLAGKMIRDGMSEVTLRWRDEETGIECKGRADYYVDKLDAAFDIKTTEDARAEFFARSMALYRYHVQHAFYADGFRSIGQPLQNFVFIAAEKRPPYAVALYTLSDKHVAIGERAMRRNLRSIRDAIEADSYKGYSEGIETIELPGWYAAREEE